MLRLSRILLVNVAMIIVYEIFDFLMWNGFMNPKVQISSWSPFGVDFKVWNAMFYAPGFWPNLPFGVFLITIIVNMIMLRKLQREYTQLEK